MCFTSRVSASSRSPLAEKYENTHSRFWPRGFFLMILLFFPPDPVVLCKKQNDDGSTGQHTHSLSINSNLGMHTMQLHKQKHLTCSEQGIHVILPHGTMGVFKAIKMINKNLQQKLRKYNAMKPTETNSATITMTGRDSVR